jgi:phytoene/squalene synthetase
MMHRRMAVIGDGQVANRPIYAAMLRIYGGLLDAIERRDYDVYTRRVRLSSGRKLLIAWDAVARHRWLGRKLSRKTP